MAQRFPAPPQVAVRGGAGTQEIRCAIFASPTLLSGCSAFLCTRTGGLLPANQEERSTDHRVSQPADTRGTLSSMSVWLPAETPAFTAAGCAVADGTSPVRCCTYRRRPQWRSSTGSVSAGKIVLSSSIVVEAPLRGTVADIDVAVLEGGVACGPGHVRA